MATPPIATIEIPHEAPAEMGVYGFRVPKISGLDAEKQIMQEACEMAESSGEEYPANVDQALERIGRDLHAHLIIRTAADIKTVETWVQNNNHQALTVATFLDELRELFPDTDPTAAGLRQGHTPIPWTVQCQGPSPGEPRWIFGPEPGNVFIARMGSTMGSHDATDEEEQANAEHIVRCVNNHDDLLAACKAVVNAPGLMGPEVQWAARLCLAAVDKVEADPLDAALDACDGDLDLVDP